MIHLTLIKTLAVIILGLVSSFIGTNTCGVTLLLIPALIFLGFNTPMAIATSKFGALGSSSTGLYGFHQGGQVDYKIGIPAAIVAMIGSFIGANVLIILPHEILHRLIGSAILLILIILLLIRTDIIIKHHAIITIKPPSLMRKIIGYIFFCIIGFMGGIFGAQAIFASYVLILVFGESFTKSVGTRKIISIAISIIALIVYGIHNFINWEYGIILIISMSIGSYLGAIYGLKKGEKWIRRLFIIIVCLMAVKLII